MKTVLSALFASTLVLLSLLFSGCAAPSETNDETIPSDHLVLSPSPEAETATRDAARLWTEHTGMTIEVAPGGVPVGYVADAVDPSGYRVCAFTIASLEVGPKSISVDDSPPVLAGCRSTVDTLAHEIGHALCHHYQPGANCHVDRGLMRSGYSVPEDNTFNAETLEKVCSIAPCITMNTESM